MLALLVWACVVRIYSEVASGRMPLCGTVGLEVIRLCVHCASSHAGKLSLRGIARTMEVRAIFLLSGGFVVCLLKQ
jgi:hypothetical protein